MQKKTLHIILVILIFAALLMSACGDKDEDKKSDESKTYTIGVLIQAPTLVSVFDGFKVEMTKLGYTEGKNVTYVFDGTTNTIDALTPEAEKLKSQKLYLLLAIGTPPALTAKEVFAGTSVPILFAPVFNPVEQGLVDSFRNPGGNLTGLQSTDTVAKSLEWLLKIVPDVKRIYVPHAPQDNSAVQSLQALTGAAEALGVELVISEGATEEEIEAIVTTIPDDVDAIYVLRSGVLGPKVNTLVQTANEHGLPTVGSDIDLPVRGVMIGFGPGYIEMGEQVARMADKVLKGTSPATIPVENAETYLGINLVTAQATGIEISDSILGQAKRVIRPESQ